MTTSARQSAAKRLSAQAEIQNFCVRSAADSCAECGGPQRAGAGRGLCSACYQHHRRTGDTEWALALAVRAARNAQYRVRQMLALGRDYDAYWREIGLAA